jgi:Ca-activated chloride channel family protein
LVVFHSQPEVLLASAPIDDEQRALAHDRIAGMTARGTTDMAGGLASAIDEVARHHDPNHINRIVLLGDGIPNEAPRVRELAQSAGQQNITVTAFGLGDEYDETLMGAVAQLSGGRFHYVEQPAEMLAFFKQEALRLDRVVARNVRLELTPGPGVTIIAVVGQQMSRHGPRGEVALGDMSLGEARDLLVRMETAPHKAGANVELIDARLRFDDPRGGAGRERHAYLGAIATTESAAIEQGRDREVERLAARISAAAETVAAIEQARQGDATAARARLARATAEAERAAGTGADAELAAQAASMRKLGAAFSDDAVDGSPPSPVVAAPAAPAEAPASESAHPKQRIRSVHDEAMQLLQ